MPVLAFILVWLVWPFALVLKFFEMFKKKEAAANSERPAKAKVFVLKEEALIREMTAAEIEQANMVLIRWVRRQIFPLVQRVGAVNEKQPFILRGCFMVRQPSTNFLCLTHRNLDGCWSERDRT